MSSLYNYSDAYMLVKRNVTVANTASTDPDSSNTNKNIILENSAPFTNCITKIINFSVGNIRDLNIVMSINNLIQYNNNYAKTPEGLSILQIESALNDNSVFVHSDGNNDTDSFNFFKKIAGRAGSSCAENVEVMVN